MKIDFWTVVVLTTFAFLLYKLYQKRKNKKTHASPSPKPEEEHKPKKGHGDGHGHDDHHHAHPEGFALLWSGIKKAGWFPWLVGILIIYMIPKAWDAWMGGKKPPTAPKVEYAVDADILGTGLLSRYTVTSYGPTFCRFDSVYNDGLFFAFDPRTGEGTCGYYGGGKPAGKIKVTSHTEPTPLSFLVLLKRQKEGAPEEWEDVKIEGKGTLKKL